MSEGGGNREGSIWVASLASPHEHAMSKDEKCVIRVEDCTSARIMRCWKEECVHEDCC